MTDQEEQSLREAKRAEERAADQIEQLARDQARSEAYVASEQAIARKLKAKAAQRAEKKPPSERKRAPLRNLADWPKTRREGKPMWPASRRLRRG
jgi:hypothetical protein